MADFRLSKWYLDCVDEAGDVAILYTGAARWGALHLNYSSIIESTGSQVATRRSLRAVDEPGVAGESLRWRSESLRVDGEWKAEANVLRAAVFASGSGSVEWHCVMPRARARVGRRQGLGYVERLAMTVPPWKLPLRTLRWGRFSSISDWVVWIDWRGEHARRLVYRDGEESRTVSLEDTHIEFDDGCRLTMDRSLVIRNGPLGSTALSGIPRIRGSVPARLLRVTECKWRSRARLEYPGGRAADGWAIHEKVEWPE